MAQTQTRKKKILQDVKKARRQRTIMTAIVISVLAVSVVVGIIFLTPHSPPNPLIGAPISTTMYNQLTRVGDSTLVAVGNPQGVTPLTPESGQTLLLSGGKIEVLYVGAEYCPYCAAERWSVIVALSKFGTFSGLTYMLSGDSPEPYPDTSTFSFRTATYTSQYNVTFVSVEEQDRNHVTLQTPTSQQQSIISQFDPQGSIPFVDVANQYVENSGSQFSPQIISGLNWTQVGSQLNNPSTGIAQAVDGAANTLIRAICNVDGGQPSSVCGLTLAPPTQAPIGVSNMPSANSFNIIATTDSQINDLVWKSSLRLIS